MKLKVGDVVVFKNYTDMSEDSRMMIDKDFFPLSGKVKEINMNGCEHYFGIEGNPYVFSKGSVARVISDVDGVDINSLKPGDEVLVKATIKDTFNEFAELIPLVDKTDVIKVLKRKSPERFIVQDDKYGMYIIGEEALSYDKSRAKIYNSRIEANNDAADMHLNAWEVLPYDD